MRIRVNLNGSYTVLEVFWADYDEDAEAVNFFTLDDDVVTVDMDLDFWHEVSFTLMCRGYYDLIRYIAIYENE